MIPNKYAVPKSQWKKWGNTSKAVFNNMYEVSVNNQAIFTHPNTKVPANEWRTVAWNHAWYAADAVKEIL